MSQKRAFVIGTLGTGKSTFLNAAIGSDVFKVGDDLVGVT